MKAKERKADGHVVECMRHSRGSLETGGDVIKVHLNHLNDLNGSIAQFMKGQAVGQARFASCLE